MSAPPTAIVRVRVDSGLKTRLEALARSTKRSKSDLAAEAIAAYVALNEWQIGEIEAGIAELNAGQTVSQKEADERYDQLLKALSIIYGIEPYVVLKDIWGSRDREVEEIARWMVDALIDAALREVTPDE